MKKSVLDSFKRIYLDENNLASYSNYYNALCLWLEENSWYFEKNLDENMRKYLNLLLNIDLDKYLAEKPDISLDLERDRMCREDFLTQNIKTETLLMLICSKLWEMVTISSDKECPVCGGGEGSCYVKIKSAKDNNYIVLLECNTCGKLFSTDGREYKNKIISYYPACKEDIV